MRRFVGRENVRKRLAPLEGTPGRTIYADGAVRIESETENLVARPPFGLAHEGEYDHVHVEPLLAGDRRGSRRGGAARPARRLRGGRLRGRAARRLEGRHALRQEPPQEGRLVREPLPPPARGAGARARRRGRRGGGRDARALARARSTSSRSAATAPPSTAVLASRPDLAWLRDRALERFFTVPEPRQRVLERLPYDLYAVELVT